MIEEFPVKKERIHFFAFRLTLQQKEKAKKKIIDGLFHKYSQKGGPLQNQQY